MQILFQFELIKKDESFSRLFVQVFFFLAYNLDLFLFVHLKNINDFIFHPKIAHSHTGRHTFDKINIDPHLFKLNLVGETVKLFLIFNGSALH